jgi:hypothetical protein
MIQRLVLSKNKFWRRRRRRRRCNLGIEMYSTAVVEDQGIHTRCPERVLLIVLRL